MKTRIILFVVSILVLSACKSTTNTPIPTTAVILTEAPVMTEAPAMTTTLEPTESLSFTPETYEDASDKFAFQYPADWTLLPEQIIGDRGAQTVLLSPGSSVETLADGGSRVLLFRYRWDPKNDLSAWSAQRKQAWEASGMVILDESTRELADGRAVIDLLMQSVDGSQVLFSLTTIGDRYMEINAQGNLELCKEILGTLRSTQ